MTILIIAEHDNGSLRKSTLNTVAAAQQIGGDIHIAVIGSGVADVAQQAAAVAGVSKVLAFDDAALAQAVFSVCTACADTRHFDSRLGIKLGMAAAASQFF